MEEKQLSYNKRQLKERPKIRQVAEQFLNDDLRGQLEAFLQYIEENKMPLSLCRANTYESKYKSKVVFRIEIALGQACAKNIYVLKVYTADDPIHFREEKRTDIQDSINRYLTQFENNMVEKFVSHLPHCRGCGKCRPGVQLEVLDKPQPGICACDIYALRFTNPSEADFMIIKEFISARKKHIFESGSTFRQ